MTQKLATLFLALVLCICACLLAGCSSCGGGNEEKDAAAETGSDGDADMDADNDGDTDGDSDTDTDGDSDSDSDSDADADGDAGDWQPLPDADSGTPCGPNCRQVTFTAEVETTYDLGNGHLVYKDYEDNLKVVRLDTMKERKVDVIVTNIYDIGFPSINYPWVYFVRVNYQGANDNLEILYRRNIDTWVMEEISRYNFSEAFSPRSLLARGKYVCMYMSPPLGDNANSYIECINPETKETKKITDSNWMYMPPFHNGELVTYAYQIPDSIPFGSGTHIIVKRISDNSVFESWSYLGDKTPDYMSTIGMVWVDWRNDTLGNKNGNSSRYNSDIYYLDLITLKETPICTHPAIQRYPATDGNLVVWMDKRNCADPNASASQDNETLYLYNLTSKTETNITEGVPGWKDYTRISGKWVTFLMPSNPGINIFAIDLSAMGLYAGVKEGLNTDSKDLKTIPKGRGVQ